MSGPNYKNISGDPKRFFEFYLPDGCDPALSVDLNRVARSRNRQVYFRFGALLSIGVVLAIFCFFLGFVLLTFTPRRILPAVASFVIGAGVIFLTVLAGRMSKYAKPFSKEGEKNITVTLDDFGIHKSSPLENRTFSYSDIKEILFYHETYYAFFGDRDAAVLPVKYLTAGNPDDLENFLAEKSSDPGAGMGK